MRKDAQANAAISILDDFLDGQNLNSILFNWTKNNLSVVNRKLNKGKRVLYH